jgi:uncharacterized protein involved in type VI secretion and phage assembly
MAILSTTHISINGNKLPYYNSCSLHQVIGEHHIMEIHCLLEVMQSFCSDNSQEMEDLLGSVITIETKSYAKIDFYGVLKFKGVITGLKYRKGMHSGSGNYVIINAKSPTVIADDGPNYTSYSDMSFTDIVNQNFTNYDSSKLSINTGNSKLTNPLAYTVQYNESAFQFAQRLAARNGEWMYYNGEELMFGLANNEEVELVLGRDLKDFNTTLKPLPQNFEYYTNDYLTDDVHEKSTTSSDGSQEGNLGPINDSSKNLYAKPTKIWVNISDDSNSKKRLDDYAFLQQSALQTNQLKVTGSSDNPGVMLASVIKIDGTTYRVTKVTHSYSSNGDEYENFFEATSTSINVYPKTNINAFPIAQSQTGKVIENHDPEGMGRVKVQLRWQQKDGLSTPWIRNISPSASQGQGFYFIPEIDDEVLVDFEGGNAECPYVVGGVYNSKTTPPSGSSNSSNHVKMLQSRSGAIFKINDEDGSITIQDKSGSSIVLDGSGNINITATKSVKVTASEELTTESGEKTNINVGSDLNVTVSSNSTVDTGTKLSVNTGAKTEISDGAKIEISAPSVGVNGKASLKLEGTTVDVDGKAITNVKGGMVNLN